MSLQYPRRTKDLPKLELDSDEESFNALTKGTNNGDSTANNMEKTQENKENLLGPNTTSSSVYTNPCMYPKRKSELPPWPLESDSDDDDNPKENQLNRAILNDSFLLSPCKSENDETDTTSNKHKQQSNDNLSFLSNFHKMALCSAKKEDPSLPHLAPSAVAATKREDKPLKTASSLNEKVTAATSSNGGALQRTQSEPTPAVPNLDIDTPLRPITNNPNILHTTSNSTSTAEAQFATPQIRSFSMQRRPRDMCISTQSQKTRSALVNEFRSQKVLFQTPMSIQRAPIPNDSLTLSLCDTIPECTDTPNSSTEKTPRRSLNRDGKKGKSKKSLEGAFNEVERNEVACRKEHHIDIVASWSSTAAEVPMQSTAAAVDNGKENILHINKSDYLVIKKLGAGGSSTVYQAKRKDNGKECALKVVDLQGDPAVVEGYLNETKLLAKLQGNVCVVSLYEYQLLQKESKLFLVMEKGDSDLHKILQQYTTNLPLYVLMNFLYQMLQAVNYIHQHGVIHSDLKPANFLMVNGRLKLIDFGIASNIALDSTSIIKFSQAGTFNYISPEALTDTSTGSSPMRSNQPKIKISTKSDVWSLGCILYLLLYQKTPFSHIKNIYAKISAISNPSHAIEYPGIPPYYPAMLVHMVKNCLQHNPKQRPSCADLLKYPFHMVIPIQNLSVPNK